MLPRKCQYTGGGTDEDTAVNNDLRAHNHTGNRNLEPIFAMACN